MASHILGFSAAGGTFPTVATPLSDIFPVMSNGYVFDRDHFIQSVWAVGTNLNRLRLNFPSENAVNPLQITQVYGGAQTFPTNPQGFIADTPIRIPAGEALSVDMGVSSATNQVTVLVEVSDSPNELPAPTGQIYAVRFSSSTTLVAHAFTQLTSVTFDQSALPAGQWSVVGIQVQSTGAQAVRVFNSGSKYRPGGLGIAALGNYNNRYFVNGRNKTLLTFNSLAWPNIEVLADSADTAEVGHIFIKRTL